MTMRPDEIAVIDDNRRCVDAVVEALTGEGYRVRTASSGQDALELLTRTSPALVILDVHLAGVSGWRLLADFRRRDAVTPVLVMSSDDRASIHEEAMIRGANGFLRKPFSPDVLRSAVRRFMDEPAACLA
jgi:DNA-binding response OmpR family regulator